MAVAATLIASNWDNADASSYQLPGGARTPPANELVYVAVINRKATAPANQATFSWGGMTWVEVATAPFGLTQSVRVTVFRGMAASPSSTVPTADFAGVTQTGCLIILDSFTGMDTSGTNGSGATAQSKTNGDGVGALSGTVTLDNAPAAGSGMYGAFAHIANEVTRAGAGFTNIGSAQGSGPNNSGLAEFKNTGDQDGDADWNTSSVWAGVYIEIKAAGAEVPFVRPTIIVPTVAAQRGSRW